MEWHIIALKPTVMFSALLIVEEAFDLLSILTLDLSENRLRPRFTSTIKKLKKKKKNYPNCSIWYLSFTLLFLDLQDANERYIRQ